jgi:hypothetical protein
VGALNVNSGHLLPLRKIGLLFGPHGNLDFQARGGVVVWVTERMIQNAVAWAVSLEKALSTHSDGSSCTARRIFSCHQLEIWRKSSRS